MGRITLGQLKQTTQGAGDDAEFRLGRAGELKTAKHGLLGRAVRWLSGATKQDRADNQKIMGDLVAGLRQKYGSEIGVAAFLRAIPGARIGAGGLPEVNTTKPLTVRQVRRAVHNAELRLGESRGANRRAMASYQAPGPDVTRGGFAGFAELAKKLKLPPLTPEQRDAYNTRLDNRVELESQHHRKQLSRDQIAQIAADTLRQVLKLSRVGGLGEATQARQAYDLALRGLLLALDDGQDANALTKLLQTANERLEVHVQAEQIGQDPDGRERGKLTELALHRVRLPKDTLARAQKNALGDDAPLRALSVAAQAVVQAGSLTRETGKRQELARAVLSITSSVATALGSRLDPVTASASQDADRLAAGRVSDTAFQQARQALANVTGQTIG